MSLTIYSRERPDVQLRWIKVGDQDGPGQQMSEPEPLPLSSIGRISNWELRIAAGVWDVGSENNLRISTCTGPESGNSSPTELAPFSLKHKTPILVLESASTCLTLPSIENGGLRSGSGERAQVGASDLQASPPSEGNRRLCGRGILNSSASCKKRGRNVALSEHAENRAESQESGVAQMSMVSPEVGGGVIGVPEVGGPHHHYERLAA